MGNRAVITTRENYDNDGVGVYLHSCEQTHHDLEDMLDTINNRQPEDMRLSDDRIKDIVEKYSMSDGLDEFFASLEVNDEALNE